MRGGMAFPRGRQHLTAGGGARGAGVGVGGGKQHALAETKREIYTVFKFHILGGLHLELGVE